jgi:hypothetical protein
MPGTSAAETTSVTDNTSACTGSSVIRDTWRITCDCGAKDSIDPIDSYGEQHKDRHCVNCHGAKHRACFVCGSCMPDGHRIDKRTCSTTCRAHLVAHYNVKFPPLTEAETAARDADLRAKFGSTMLPPEVAAKRDRERHIIHTAECCYKCEAPFLPGDVIYRTGGRFAPIRPVCELHRDVPPHVLRSGKVITQTPTRYSKSEPCEHCGRPVAYSPHAQPHKYVRQWTYSGEHEPKVHVLCSEQCRRQAGARRVERETRPCEVCGEMFTARAGALTCSDRCRQTRRRLALASFDLYHESNDTKETTR